MKVLVVGRSGQIARALVRAAAERRIDLEALGRPQLDLSNPNVADVIAAVLPDVVINAAAYTAVDAAESNREQAFRINAEGAGAIADGAAQVGAALIHLSTDYVFSGRKQGAYAEDDPVEPLNVYGASKLLGEKLVCRSDPRAIIVRTAWVYDAEAANFVRTMLRLAHKQPAIDVVADQWGCPTFAPDLAECLLDLSERVQTGEGVRGVYHCAGAGGASRAAFASEIFSQAKQAGGPSAEVKPIASNDFVAAAARPANARLDCSKLARDYGVSMRPWREGLSACIAEIARRGWSEQ